MCKITGKDSDQSPDGPLIIKEKVCVNQPKMYFLQKNKNKKFFKLKTDVSS